MKYIKLTKAALLSVIIFCGCPAYANETIKNVIITSVGFDYVETNCSIKYKVGEGPTQLAQWDCAMSYSNIREADTSAENFLSVVSLAYTTQSSIDITVSRSTHMTRSGQKTDKLIAITVEKK